MLITVFIWGDTIENNIGDIFPAVRSPWTEYLLSRPPVSIQALNTGQNDNHEAMRSTKTWRQ